jgi:hypothetical protein
MQSSRISFLSPPLIFDLWQSAIFYFAGCQYLREKWPIGGVAVPGLAVAEIGEGGKL